MEVSSICMNVPRAKAAARVTALRLPVRAGAGATMAGGGAHEPPANIGELVLASVLRSRLSRGPASCALGASIVSDDRRDSAHPQAGSVGPRRSAGSVAVRCVPSS